MAVAAVTIHLPDALWHAVQLLAPHGGDPNAIILRTLEEYITATQKRGRQRTGKCQKLAQSLGMPRADLHLSARPAAALQTLNIRYVYERVQKTPLDLVVSPNFGQKSLKQIKETLATLGLTLSMTLEDDAYRAAVVAAVAANIEAARG